MTPPVRSLRQAAAGGVLWTASSHAARQVVQLGITVVLARALVPDDFGLIGMAAVALAFVAPLNEMGMGAALVQRRVLEPGHAGSVFWFQVLVTAAAALALTLAAPFIAAFFGRAELVPLMRVLCWTLPLGAAAAAPQALLLRSLRFGSVAFVETFALAASGALAVGMALRGWGVWSLAAQTVAGTLLTCALMIPLSGFNPLSPAARPALSRLKELAGFSLPLTGYQIFNFFSRNLDDLLIGRLLGAQALGFYSMAYRVMMFPLQKVSGIVGRVCFPAFSSMGDDIARIREVYLKSVQYISLVTFPLMAAVMVTAPELTRAAFGPQWGAVAPLVTVLALPGMVGSVGTTVGSLFLARGRSGLMLSWEVAACTVYTVAIVIGLWWGLMGVAVAYAIASLALWPISHAVANRLIDLTMGRFLRALAPAAGLALGLGSTLMALRVAWSPAPDGSNVRFLATSALISFTALGLGAMLRRPAALGEMRDLAFDTLAGMRARRGTASS
ncbi:MAG: lipopolysaccharide biosynthesis protein [Candidatus Polarisedimenticolia bacterium]